MSQALPAVLAGRASSRRSTERDRMPTMEGVGEAFLSEEKCHAISRSVEAVANRQGVA
jgi:hypothetical protein